MVHLHHEFAHFGSELFVLGFQLTFPRRWTIDQGVVAVLRPPTLDETSRYLMISRGLGDGQMTGLDLRDELTFEFGFELSTDFSHYEYRAPHPPTEKSAGVRGCGKCRS